MDRLLEAYAEKCPAYQSVKGCIECSWDAEVEEGYPADQEDWSRNLAGHGPDPERHMPLPTVVGQGRMLSLW